jgi:hypothetical protein
MIVMMATNRNYFKLGCCNFGWWTKGGKVFNEEEERRNEG